MIFDLARKRSRVKVSPQGVKDDTTNTERPTAFAEATAAGAKHSTLY